MPGTPSGVARRRVCLELTLAATMAAAVIGMIWATFGWHPATKGRTEALLPADLESLDGAATMGNPGASVALVEYSDFQCPYCGVFARETLPRLEQEYVADGRIRIVFRYLPLPIHPFAFKAAEGAECAARQGRFWEMHDQLFRNQDHLDEDSLRQYATAVGIGMARFAVCLGGEAAERIEHDRRHASDLGFFGTPVFLVGSIQGNGRLRVNEIITGARPLAQFASALDRLSSGSPKSTLFLSHLPYPLR
jgi:protein-disulfide isomerase